MASLKAKSISTVLDDNMKATPQELKIMARMRPGAITLNGFLGDDRRNLYDIIEDDGRTLQRLGKQAGEIAARMNFLTRQSWDLYGEDILVEDTYLVSTDVVRGKLPCPFSHPGIYRKAITTLTNTKNGITVRWTSLSIHLIEAHGFFEGKGSPFRLDPETLCKAIF